jgi:hypothetical protein
VDRLGILISPIEANFDDGKPFARTPHGHVYRVSPECAARAEFQTLYLLKRDVSMEFPEEPAEKFYKAIQQVFDDVGTFPPLSMSLYGSKPGLGRVPSRKSRRSRILYIFCAFTARSYYPRTSPYLHRTDTTHFLLLERVFTSTYGEHPRPAKNVASRSRLSRTASTSWWFVHMRA